MIMFLSSALLSASVLLVPAHGDQDRPPSAVLPATTIAFAEFAGLTACRNAAEASDLVRMLETLATEKLGARPSEMFARGVLARMDREMEEIGIDAKGLRALLRHPLAVAAGRPVSFDDEMIPSIAVVIDAEDDPEGVMRVVDTFLGAFTAKASLSLSEEEIGGVRVRVVRHDRHTGEIAFARVERFVVGTVGTGLMRDIIRTERGDGSSIRTSPVAEAARAKVGDSPLLWGCANLRPITELLRTYLPYEADPILAALGIESLDGIAFGASLRDGTSSEFFQVVGSVRAGGLLAGLGGARVDPALLDAFPSDTLLVAGMAMDAPTIAKGVHAILESLPAPVLSEVRRQFEREVGRELQREGVPVDELLKLVHAIGPDCVLGVSMPPTDLGIPRGLLVCRLRPGAGIADRIAGHLTRAHLDVRSQDVDGHVLRWLVIDGVPSGMSPAFVEVGDRLLVSNDVRFLRTRIRGEQEGVRAPQGSAGAVCMEQSAGFLWLRARDTISGVWGRYGPMLENLIESTPGLPIEADDLPTAEELHAALRDVTFGAGIDAHGFTLQVTCPLGLGTALAVFGALFDEAAGGSSRKTG